jgi:OOP family OmpA-OmpF porin
MMAAPSSSSSATVDTTAARGEYAYYEANKVVRTAFGQCVKTGLWAAASPNAPCEPGMVAKKPAPKPAIVAAAAPTAAIAPKPEPVEVQPLAPAAVREERALEPEPVVAPAPAPAKPPVESTSLSADALFALSSATLKPTARERLDALASRMMSMDYKTIRVVGHTDPTGSPELNEKLSRKRADAVKQYLVSRGVDSKRIITEGMGSAMPMVTDVDCSMLPRAKKIACYQPDRRVEIEVTGTLSKTGSAAQPSMARNR